ncbi:hypothetical protein TRAPUB_11306 [Trametes pubescens]|uniref:Uncharacterized protein n=1 Tax=Trametes pubescens TaxID=154538 RepID=A0A1M2VPC1_TRAPU|nr:hypothetical protein TRAPUB_14082 [Trametes pubescens]OJT12126.1 hypothetical protein TRAPUB_11325 [Trametes pubescens]OJT12128.1 hypothetical protein TRAPUB_11327 [Trametes pubescens]OJT12129.1 hypothetical protein TRAPUB_11306 [Trametes pubescens]
MNNIPPPVAPLAHGVEAAPPGAETATPAEDPNKPTLELLIDSWTSPAYGPFTAVMARLEDANTQVNFTIPHVYEDLMGSRDRWRGWLELLDDPAGAGIIPPGLTDKQRDVMRRLARTLIHFSTQSASAEHESDWARFINKLEEYARLEGLTDEVHLAVVMDWARQEHKESRAWRTLHTAHATEMHASSALPNDVNARDTTEVVPDATEDNGCLSDVPSLETVSGSGYGSD